MSDVAKIRRQQALHCGRSAPPAGLVLWQVCAAGGPCIVAKMRHRRALHCGRSAPPAGLVLWLKCATDGPCISTSPHRSLNAELPAGFDYAISAWRANDKAYCLAKQPILQVYAGGNLRVFAVRGSLGNTKALGGSPFAK